VTGETGAEAGAGQAVVAVHCGRFGDAMAAGLAVVVPEVRFVPTSTEEARGAEVLVTLADEDTGALSADIGPSVRWVHVLGAGVDGFPFEALGDRVLTCSRGASSQAIAEFVLAAMLAFEKHLPDSWIREPPNEWNVAQLGGLAGKTLGLVGIGAIGTEIARRALAFDMEVLALRRRPEVPPPQGVALVGELPALLSASDHVVIAAPATPSTRHLLDKSAFSEMKPGAHLVNISRGTLVDHEALVEALDEGRLAMATLDVVDPEPLPPGHLLYSHPKIRLSPHISWSSPHTALRTLEMFKENLVRYRNGEPLAHVVDPEAGY
jgi:phosphoglycerate dehydrogenase-like enzyme